MIRLYAPMLLLGLAACSGGGSTNGDNASAPVALVSLATAQQTAIEQMVVLYGAVENGAEAQYTLSAPVEAMVDAVLAPAGTAVGRGETVVRLRPSPSTRANLTKALADARTAEAAYARAGRLRADGLASDADVESARAAARSAQALLDSLTAQAGALALRAPGSGYVSTVATNPGDLVQPGTVVATIARTGNMRARFGVEPGLAKTLSVGSVMQILPVGEGSAFEAPILSIDPTIDPQTRLASIFVSVPAERGLGSGQPLTAKVAVAQSNGAITIPYAGLLDDGGQPYVFVVQAGVAHRHDVATGASDSDRVAITNGIASGDKVVIAGGTGVEDGMKVRTK